MKRILFVLIWLFSLSIILCPYGIAQNQSGEKGVFKKKRKKVQVSTYELSIRLADVNIHALSLVEETADKIINETSYSSVKEAAMLLKIYYVSAIYKAMYITDPLIGYFEIWALHKQLIQYFKDGEGKSRFVIRDRDNVPIGTIKGVLP